MTISTRCVGASAKGRQMIGRNSAAETVVIAASRGVARACFVLYVLAFVVLPVGFLGLSFWGVLWFFVAAMIGIGGYVRFSSMRLVVGDEKVTVVNLLTRYSLDTATARIVVNDASAFWADGELREGRANMLTLTDASEREVLVGVAPTLGERHRAVIEDFNIALARHRLAS